MKTTKYTIYRSPLEKILGVNGERIHKIKNNQDLQRLTAKVKANNSYAITAVQRKNDN